MHSSSQAWGGSYGHSGLVRKPMHAYLLDALFSRCTWQKYDQMLHELCSRGWRRFLSCLQLHMLAKEVHATCCCIEAVGSSAVLWTASRSSPSDESVSDSLATSAAKLSPAKACRKQAPAASYEFVHTAWRIYENMIHMSSYSRGARTGDSRHFLLVML